MIKSRNIKVFSIMALLVVILTFLGLSANAQSDDSRSETVTNTWGSSQIVFDRASGSLTIKEGSLSKVNSITLDRSGKSFTTLVKDKKGNPKDYIKKVNTRATDVADIYVGNSDESSPIYKDEVKKIIIEGGVKAPSDAGFLFSGNYKSWVDNKGHSVWFTNLETIEGVLDTSNVEYMNNMFENAESLTSLDLSKWNTSNVKSMHAMFNYAESLESINVIGLDTTKLEYMDSMFAHNYNLKSLDLNSWKGLALSSLNSTFSDMPSLTNLEINKLSVNNVGDFSYMLEDTNKLKLLNLDNWNISSGSSVKDMFKGLVDVQFVKLGKNSKFGSDTNFPNISNDKLSGIWTSVTNNNAKYENGSTFIGNYNGTVPGWYVNKLKDNNVVASMWGSSLVEFNVSNGLLDVYDGTLKSKRDATTLDELDLIGKANVKEINLLDSVVAPEDSSFLFSGVDGAVYKSLIKIKGDLDTRNVINMSHMFFNSDSLVDLDTSKWDTGKVTDMSNMFSFVSMLPGLDVGNWDTSSVVNMSQMFDDAYSLKSLEVEHWDTGSVIYMSGMFNGCAGLTSLDVSDWDTSKVVSMAGMFANMTGLTGELDFDNWDTGNVTDMKKMFENVSSISYLNVNRFDTKNVKNMSWMFSGTTNLEYLSVANWSVSNVETMNGMFYNTGVSILHGIENWEASSVLNFKSMFNGAKNLKILNLTNLNNLEQPDMSSMFTNMESLERLDISSLYNNQGLRLELLEAFKGVGKLKYIKLGEKFSFEYASQYNVMSFNPNIPVSEGYTGGWVLNESGDNYKPITPNGKVYKTTDSFVRNYAGKEPGWYTWEKDTKVIPTIPEITDTDKPEIKYPVVEVDDNNFEIDYDFACDTVYAAGMFKVEDTDKVEYTITLNGNNLVIKAKAKAGYTLVGQDEWNIQLPIIEKCPTIVIPEQPGIEDEENPGTIIPLEKEDGKLVLPKDIEISCDAKLQVVLPKVEGLIYESKEISADVYEINVKADDGYTIKEGSAIKWTIDLTSFKDLCDDGVITIPEISKPGVVDPNETEKEIPFVPGTGENEGINVVKPGFEIACGDEKFVAEQIIEDLTNKVVGVKYDANISGDILTITISPINSDYKFSENQVTEFKYKLPEIKACLIEVTPVLPGVVNPDGKEYEISKNANGDWVLNYDFACGTEYKLDMFNLKIDSDSKGIDYSIDLVNNTLVIKAKVQVGFEFSENALDEWIIKLPTIDKCVTGNPEVLNPEEGDKPFTTKTVDGKLVIDYDFGCNTIYKDEMFKIKEQEGINYTFVIENNSLVINATAKDNYELQGEKSWTIDLPTIVPCDETIPEVDKPGIVDPNKPEVTIPYEPGDNGIYVVKPDFKLECGNEGFSVDSISETLQNKVPGVSYTPVISGNILTITITPMEGYKFSENQVTEFKYKLPVIEKCDVEITTPTKPEIANPGGEEYEIDIDANGNLVLNGDFECNVVYTVDMFKVKEQVGVRYTLEIKNNSSLVVKASAEKGYKLVGKTEWTIKLPEVVACDTDKEVTPVQPGVTNPEGGDYEITIDANGNLVLEGNFECDVVYTKDMFEVKEQEGINFTLNIENNSTLIIKAKAKEGYKLSSGIDEWHIKLPAVVPCDTDIEVTIPTKPEITSPTEPGIKYPVEIVDGKLVMDYDFVCDVEYSKNMFKVKEQTGVIYDLSVNGNILTIVAVAQDGYKLVGEDKWVIQLPKVKPCTTDKEITPTKPGVVNPTNPDTEIPLVEENGKLVLPKDLEISCNSSLEVLKPKQDGVEYTVIDLGNGSYKVGASAKEGYKFSDGAITEWVIDLSSFKDICKEEVITIPEINKPGVVDPNKPSVEIPFEKDDNGIYVVKPGFELACGDNAFVAEQVIKSLLDTVVGVKYHATIEASTLVITIQPEKGYKFSEGQVTEFKYQLPVIEKCSIDDNTGGITDGEEDDNDINDMSKTKLPTTGDDSLVSAIISLGGLITLISIYAVRKRVI